MSCCYGHGHCHHWAHGYGPELGYGYGRGIAPGARGARRRRARVEDLEEYLGDLEDEVASVRAELEELKGRSPGQ
ncbi:MAG: hypothetical protein M0Z46_11980 [Actinomycetota bacterium]|jgi:hypothetical protein|nr:hypothetical protein [Actinomycetota bacterium]